MEGRTMSHFIIINYQVLSLRPTLDNEDSLITQEIPNV